jgi:serine protease Do
MISTQYWLSLLLILASGLANAAEDRDTKVRKDRDDVMADGRWIYNDLPKALAEASATRKPMLVVFRCIP